MYSYAVVISVLIQPRQFDQYLNQSEGVVFAITIALLHIILLITWLPIPNKSIICHCNQFLITQFVYVFIHI